MAFGFHLIVNQICPTEEVLRRMDGVAGVLGFSTTASACHGYQQRCYRQGEHYPELKVAFNFQPQRYEISMYPLEEKEVLDYGAVVLVKLWSSISTSLDAALGRTFLDIGYGTIQPAEIEGPLQFLDWYQYFPSSVVNRWGISYLRAGPFYKVEEYSNGACGIWLAAFPFERLGRMKAAEYLGVKLPRLYGKNPQTGEQMYIPWD
jgi:hypothetical protein